MSDRRLYFNGIQAETGRYLLPPMTTSELAARVRGQNLLVPETRPLRADRTAEHLAEAGWKVVFGADVTPEDRDALAPLLELRRSQAGDLYREDLVYYGVDFVVRTQSIPNPEVLR